MKTVRIMAYALAVIVLILVVCLPTLVHSKNGETILLPAVCNARLAPLQISWKLPAEVEGELKQKNLNVVQRATDIFAWQEFIALNWPAKRGERGVPGIA